NGATTPEKFADLRKKIDLIYDDDKEKYHLALKHYHESLEMKTTSSEAFLGQMGFSPVTGKN
ncbi:unnamed protein product, partial [Didymodactylos carnosus]